MKYIITFDVSVSRPYERYPVSGDNYKTEVDVEIEASSYEDAARKLGRALGLLIRASVEP